MDYVRNAWYVAGWSSEFDDPFAALPCLKTIL